MDDIGVAAENAVELLRGLIRGVNRGVMPQAEIDNDVDIFSLGYINSLFAMELVMFVEKTYGFTVPTDELRIDNFRTVAALSALVERHRIVILVG